AAFSNNHHNDGHVAVCIPALPGEQEALIASFPEDLLQATLRRGQRLGRNRTRPDRRRRTWRSPQRSLETDRQPAPQVSANLPVARGGKATFANCIPGNVR